MFGQQIARACACAGQLQPERRPVCPSSTSRLLCRCAYTACRGLQCCNRTQSERRL
ncbi:uncharacterized protein LY79DRAFT_558794 [Colletotrichum navitas]|uniref:Uncharacterized protein n=1 Tax=Colletotrichum navitas TaxID=681940 RepID=A0AAD8V2Z2_9PEZI|nr:uncharacterized protein LY79DRAFT_558794 [Colletotrichum navitas]KAK1585323.1 hypothetical protein LY79DRAFT_558794 [Colletotrichum navitas]